MKNKKFYVLVISLIILAAITGVGTADPVVPAVPEIQGITSSTIIAAEGTVMYSAVLGWQLEDMDWVDTGLAERGGRIVEVPARYGGGVVIWPYMLDPTKVQYSTTYDTSTTAQHGQTTFIKTMGISTADKFLTQSNVKTTTEATFLATGDGGNILGTESIMIDGAGMPTNASDRMICPFGAGEQWNPSVLQSRHGRKQV